MHASKPDREETDKLIKEQLTIINRDEGDIQQAIEILAGVDDPEIIDHLIDILDNKAVETRITAIRELGRLGGKKAVKTLEKVLKGANEKDDAAGNFLVRLFTENAIDGGTLTKMTAAEALAETGEPAAVEPLLDAVSDSNPRVKLAAATALTELLERLTRALEKGEGDQFEILEAAKKMEERGGEVERAMKSLQEAREAQEEIEQVQEEDDPFAILRKVDAVLDEIDDLEVLEEMIKRLLK